MKTKIITNSVKSAARHDNAGAGSRTLFPHTDYSFQETSGFRGFSGTQNEENVPGANGFRNLSREYFHVETRSFFAELWAFGAIVAVTAWPIVTMVRTVVHLMR